jgi:hypothetical protein
MFAANIVKQSSVILACLMLIFTIRNVPYQNLSMRSASPRAGEAKTMLHVGYKVDETKERKS